MQALGPLHIILVRHGQSENNVLEAECASPAAYNELRSSDPPLSAIGHQQATLLGARLGAQLCEAAAKGQVELRCSTMARALQTAQPLARVLGQPVLVDPELVEKWGFFEEHTGEGSAVRQRIAISGPRRREIANRYPAYNVSLVRSV